MIIPAIWLAVLFAGIYICHVIYGKSNVTERALNVFIAGFILGMILAFIGVPYIIGVQHEREHLRVAHKLSVRYPQIQFTEVGVLYKYIEFHPKGQPQLKCNGTIIHVQSQWVVTHGSVDCATAQGESILADATQEDLNKEIVAKDNFTKDQKNPPWWIIAGL